jgi:predicted amidohydrolase
MINVAVVQTNPAFGRREQNVREAVGLIEASSADIYVLPELFNTGYNIIDAAEAVQLAEPGDGPTFRAIAKVAKRRSCYVAYGFAENAGRIYNSAALVGPSGLVGLYRKVHLYNRETLFFSPGDLGFPVFDLPFGKVGMMICFDWIYPESARTLALKGAQLILHPSNLVMPYCPDAMITRCLENRVFAATANRIGEEERGGVKFSYIGTSEIVSFRGEILCRLGAGQTGVGVAGVDLAQAADKRINEYNDLLRDRRGPQYAL